MRVLVIAPHPDDEVLGCGATIAKRVSAGDKVYVCIVTEGREPMYSKKFIKKERKEMYDALKSLGVQNILLLQFPSAQLDTIPQHIINDVIMDVINTVKPDEVFIPHIGDMHKDHQIVADAAMVAVRPNGKFRVKRVLAYETLSETDWNIPNQQNAFIPNVYEDVGDFLYSKAVAFSKYESQVRKFPAARSLGALKALAEHRGAIVGMKHAEAFMLIREVTE